MNNFEQLIKAKQPWPITAITVRTEILNNAEGKTFPNKNTASYYSPILIYDYLVGRFTWVRML